MSVNYSETSKILPNTIYLALYAPQINDYHRSIFISYPLIFCAPAPNTSGTLLHATYDDELGSWSFESFPVRDVTAFKTLILLWRLSTIQGDTIEKQFERIENILSALPLKTDAGLEYQGNHVSSTYDCVLWTTDALNALLKEGFIPDTGLSGKEIMEKARETIGPEDATLVVGMDFGGLKVVN